MTGSLEDRCVRHVEEARLFESARTLVVAHSGGSDSTALLLLASAWASARGVAVMSAHVAHGLRGEAGEEDARFCARLAATLSVRFTLHPVDVPSGRRKGEEILTGEVGLIKQRFQPLPIQAQQWRHERRVVDLRSFCPGEFADSVHRVMVVEGEQQAAFRCKRKGLSDKFESSGGVGRKDQYVLIGAGVEVTQDRPAGALEVAGHRRGGWVVGVWIAKDGGGQQRQGLFKLGLGTQRTASVIEVYLAELVQTAVFGGAQSIQRGGSGVSGIAPGEVCIRGFHLRFTLGNAGGHSDYLIWNLHLERF